MDTDIILTEDDLFQLNCLLTRIVDISRSDFVMLINRSGRLISAQGETSDFDKTSLAALISGYFASSNSIASILGEKAFTGMIQEGYNHHIYVSHLDENTIISCIFDKRSNIDKVKTTVLKFNQPLIEQLTILYKGIESSPEININVSPSQKKTVETAPPSTSANSGISGKPAAVPPALTKVEPEKIVKK